MPTLQRSNRGFTLVELVVAMVITLVAVLGLLQAVGVMGAQNLGNATRDEAMQIAEATMNDLRTRPFDQISTAANQDLYPGIDSTTHQWAPDRVRSRLRGVTVSYAVTKSAKPLSANSDFLQVAVRWRFKNTSTSQGLQSIRSNDEK